MNENGYYILDGNIIMGFDLETSCPLSNECHLVVIIIPSHMCHETSIYTININGFFKGTEKSHPKATRSPH